MRLQSISSSEAESRLHGVQCKFYQSYDILFRRAELRHIVLEREISDNAHRQAWDSNDEMISQCSEACTSGQRYKILMTKYILEKYEVVETITMEEDRDDFGSLTVIKVKLCENLRIPAK